MLKLAKRDGYFSDSEAAEFLSEDPYLAPLRPREDFQALLESLESE